jgi:uncharacterized protein
VKRWNISLNQFVLLPPIGKRESADVVQELTSHIDKKQLPPMYGVDEKQSESFWKLGFVVRSVRNSWDYVYLTEDLINLPGKKYYVKRKNINRCLGEHKAEYKPIKDDIIDECLNMQTNWCNLRNCEATFGLEAENKAIKELFSHFKELNVFGGVVLIDGKVEAFTVGEQLNKDTAVIHFEKANPDIFGLYQVVNQWFCANALKGFKYVNREQDLGIPGLRQAKMSYNPAFFVEKFLATI